MDHGRDLEGREGELPHVAMHADRKGYWHEVHSAGVLQGLDGETTWIIGRTHSGSWPSP